MSEKKNDQDEPLMEGRFSINLAELRPVDQIFPEAHRSIAIATGNCASPPIGCGRKVAGFTDAISAKEYQITGFCQSCQDRFYAEMAEDEEAGEFDITGPSGEA
jgi:hypothetical protein